MAAETAPSTPRDLHGADGGQLADAPGVIALPPLVYALGLLIGLAMNAILPAPDVPQIVRFAVGGLLLLAGLALAAAFFGSFRRAGTPVDTSRATSSIVTSGPFRLSRNPGYLSLALIYVALACLLDAPWALITLLPALIVIQRGVIEREERYLERKFGAEYSDYKAQTRRWI